ncbi:MAG: bis(5'-nucleosyl)-tetraphosphatase (symmetrical) [Gammaproteobacteria bacterium RBG_16_57_12]|nr:MAG: bis(5'-nucleosyl)-tetraphosphatase (symmetrical) [Gammaproteobacteria bacterium RBG_16_57_12]
MATYVIGDVQGCMSELQALLEAIQFNSGQDRLWFTGDLVNRGPQSLEVLRLVKGLGEQAITVLGNHDLHLLALAARGDMPGSRDSSLQAILSAPDREELLAWLRRRPLLHYDPAGGIVLAHAGLAPPWDLTTALTCAAELEQALSGPHYHAYFSHMYGNTPDQWRDDLEGWERLRYITNALTRMRYVDEQGRLDLKCKGPPGTQPNNLQPWFASPRRRNRELTIVFGHWAALGYYQGFGVYGVDGGCVWGGCLTALCLDDFSHVSVPCRRQS